MTSDDVEMESPDCGEGLKDKEQIMVEFTSETGNLFQISDA